MKRISHLVSRRPALPGAAFAVCCALIAAIGVGAQAASRKAAPVVAPSGPPPWPGSRVVMVLPLKLGEGWNADRATGQALLQPAEERLVNALAATGKLSPVQPHRFSPLLQRANRDGALSADGALSDDEFRTLVDNPTLPNARTLIGKLTFDQPAMIADCTLEEIRVSGTAQRPALQMQVSGRLYQGTDEVAFRTIVVTSDAQPGGSTNFDRALLASGNAFRQVAEAFVAPLPDIALTFPGTTPATGGTSTMKPPMSGTGTSAGMGGTGIAAPLVETPPLPEDSARGGLPEFPQGRLPLTPGVADPNRFQGTPPADTAPPAVAPAPQPAPAPAPAADPDPATVDPAPADVMPAPADAVPPPTPADPAPAPADAAPVDAAPDAPAPDDAAPAEAAPDEAMPAVPDEGG